MIAGVRETTMKALHRETPIWESLPLSRALGATVLLKMEALQPVGSFKIRGLGRACQESVAAGAAKRRCGSRCANARWGSCATCC